MSAEPATPSSRSGREAVLDRIGRSGVVAIYRGPSAEGLLDAASALASGEVSALEITLTVPAALDAISALRAELGEQIAIGAGTVLTASAARDALSAGAQFVVLPGLAPDVVEVCADADVLCVPGALTPTEVMAALSLGVDVIKLFPARVATPAYLADLLGPLPHARFLPTGSIDAEAARAYIRRGAFAVGVGSALIDPDTVRARDVAAIEDTARSLVAAVGQARTPADPTRPPGDGPADG